MGRKRNAVRDCIEAGLARGYWGTGTPAKSMEPCGNVRVLKGKQTCLDCGHTVKKHLCSCGCGLGTHAPTIVPRN